MIAVLITNELTKIVVLADKFETTDLSYNLTFGRQNRYRNMVLQNLKGSTFHTLIDWNNYLIVCLPLEGWNCTEISDNEYKEIISRKREPKFLLEKALNFNASLPNNFLSENNYFIVRYKNNNDDGYVRIMLFSIKYERVNDGFIAAIEIIGKSKISYFKEHGVPVDKTWFKFDTLDCLYEYIINDCLSLQTKYIISIDRISETMFY